MKKVTHPISLSFLLSGAPPRHHRPPPPFLPCLGSRAHKGGRRPFPLAKSPSLDPFALYLLILMKS